MQDLSHDEIYVIAKKISRELSEFPLHSHGALIQLINIGFEHRKLTMQRAEKEAQDAQHERALRLQEQQIGLMEAERQRTDAGMIKAVPELVAQGN